MRTWHAGLKVKTNLSNLVCGTFLGWLGYLLMELEIHSLLMQYLHWLKLWNLLEFQNKKENVWLSPLAVAATDWEGSSRFKPSRYASQVNSFKYWIVFVLGKGSKWKKLENSTLGGDSKWVNGSRPFFPFWTLPLLKRLVQTLDICLSSQVGPHRILSVRPRYTVKYYLWYRMLKECVNQILSIE